MWERRHAADVIFGWWVPEKKKNDCIKMEKTFKSSVVVVVMTLTQFKLFLVFTTSFVCWALIFFGCSSWQYSACTCKCDRSESTISQPRSCPQLSSLPAILKCYSSYRESKNLSTKVGLIFMMSFLIFSISNWKSLIYAVAKFNLYFSIAIRSSKFALWKCLVRVRVDWRATGHCQHWS